MKPAPFDYVAPRTVAEAVDHLARHGDDARVLAGGQSLVRLMNTRLATPAVIVDINRVEGLDVIGAENGSVRIGATARQRAAELHDLVRSGTPLFAQAGAHVAHPPVRRRGTVVGSIAFADPSAELPAAFLALDGEAVVTGPDGERTVAAADLFTGAFRTSLAAGELITAVRVPRGGDGRPARPGPRSPAARATSRYAARARSSRSATAARSPRRASRCAAWAPRRSGRPPSRRRSPAPSPQRMRSPPPPTAPRATSTRRATPTARPTTAVTSPSS